MTAAQKQLLDANLHLFAVARLEDGDLLVVDMQPAETFPNGHYGPYVLTKNGYLHDVNYHYGKYHAVDCPYITS